MMPSQPGLAGAAPAKWSPSSTVTRNSVLDLLMPSLARRWKNAANAALYCLSCSTKPAWPGPNALPPLASDDA